MDSVSPGHQRDVDVVVDDEERARGRRRFAQSLRHLEQLGARQRLVAKLDYVGASAQGGGGDRKEFLGILVRRDDVQPGGCEPLEVQLRIWRSFSRKAGGAVSQSQECLMRRLRCDWNS